MQIYFRFTKKEIPGRYGIKIMTQGNVFFFKYLNFKFFRIGITDKCLF